MKRVYVAGPMRADEMFDMLDNISTGIRYGSILLEKGFAPFVPHLDINFRIQRGAEYKVPVKTYQEYSMKWLEVSDCVFVCPGWEKSLGTLAEMDRAKELNIPIYFSVEELCEHEG